MRVHSIKTFDKKSQQNQGITQFNLIRKNHQEETITNLLA